MLINHTFIRDSEKFFLEKAIEELREKYIKIHPEGPASSTNKKDVQFRYSLLMVFSPKEIFLIKKKTALY